MKKKDTNKKERKALKEALRSETSPLMIGLRNEMKGTNERLDRILAKDNTVHELQIKVGKDGEIKLRGKDGKTPIRGVDYFTDADIKHIVSLASPQKGKDYFTASEKIAFVKSATPKKGVDYFDGKTPVFGVDFWTKAEQEKFASDILERATPIKGIHFHDGKKGDKGETVIRREEVNVSPEDIRDRLESLKGSARLSVKAIKGIEELVASLMNSATPIGVGGSGGGAVGVDQFIELIDAPSSYSGQAGKGVRVNAGATGLEFYTVVDTDEKAKVSANDTTAGYLNGKLTAENGILFTENNNGANENLGIRVDEAANFDWGGTHTFLEQIVLYGYPHLNGFVTNGIFYAGATAMRQDSAFVYDDTTDELTVPAIILSGQTASRAVALSGSKTLIAAVTTLTELNYLSGATSAIQTQINTAKTTSFGITIDGGGSAITTGSKGYIIVPQGMTITGWTIVADQSGSIVIDVKRSTYSGFPTTATIAGSEKPTLSSAQKNQDLTLTSFTTSIASGDIIEFVVDSAATVTRVNLVIHGTK